MIYQTNLLAVSTAMFLALGTAVQADVVHATWGGGGAITLREAVTDPFSKATGITATVAEVPNTAGVLRAPTAKQYGAVTVTFFEGASLAKEGLLEAFEDSEIPNLADLPPALVLRNDEGKVVGVTGYFAFYGIAINTDFVKPEEVGSWNNLADAKFKGKIAVTRPVYGAPYDLTAFSYANGGSEKDVEKGLEAMKGVYANSLTTYTSMAHMNTLLTSGEAIAAPYYSSRIWHMKHDGLKNIEIVVPKEGGLILPYAIVVPKGVANHDEAAKYLSFSLDAKVQYEIADKTGNIPSSTRAELPPNFTDIYGLTKDEMREKLITPDWGVIVADYERRVDALEVLMAQ